MKRKTELSDLHDLSGEYTLAAEAVEHAVIALDAALSARRFPVRADRFLEMQMRRDMPYVIHATAQANTQILVNRQYKPLGSIVPGSVYSVRYEDYPQVHVHLTEAQIAKVVSPLGSRGLFHDGSQPWIGRQQATAYLARLQRLYEFVKAAA